MPAIYQSYLWSNGDTTPQTTISQGGSYSVIVDRGYCTDSAYLQVNAHASPQVSLGNIQVACNTYNLDLVGNPNINVQYQIDSMGWQNSPTFTGLASGQHIIQIQENTWNCIGKDTIFLPLIPNDSIRITGDSIFCQGNNVVLQATAGYASYLWSNSSLLDFLTTNQTGWYWVQGVDTNGCTQRDSLFLQYYPQPDLVLDSVQRGCTNGSSSLLFSTNQGASPYLYALNSQSFQNNAGVFSALSDGNYWGKVIDVNGCRDSLSVNVMAYPPMSITANLLSPESCVLKKDGNAEVIVNIGNPPINILGSRLINIPLYYKMWRQGIILLK